METEEAQPPTAEQMFYQYVATRADNINETMAAVATGVNAQTEQLKSLAHNGSWLNLANSIPIFSGDRRKDLKQWIK